MEWSDGLVSHFKKLKSYSLDQAEAYRDEAFFWRVTTVIVQVVPAIIGAVFGYISNYRSNDVEKCENDRWDSYANLSATICLIIVSMYAIYHRGGEKRQMFLDGAEMYCNAASRIDVELSLRMLGRESPPELLLNTMADVIRTTDHKLLSGHYVNPSEFHAKIAQTLRVLGVRDLEDILKIMCPDGDEDCIVRRTEEITAVAEVRIDVST